jgi:hypothetical protein
MAGLIALAAGFYFLFSRLPRRSMIYCALVLLFSFTTYPLITYVIFWIWLTALLLMAQRRSSDSARRSASPEPVAGTFSGGVLARRMSIGTRWSAPWLERGRSGGQIADLLYILIVLLLALGAIAATRPDITSAKSALDAAGLHSVRVHTLIVPCHSDRGWSLYGVFFDASIASAQAVNTACFTMRDKSWTISGPFDGF